MVGYLAPTGVPAAHPEDLTMTSRNHRSRSGRTLAVIALAALGACGGGQQDAAGGGTSVLAAPATTALPARAVTTTVAEPTSTSTSTTATASPVTDPPAAEGWFIDPAGAYEMSVDPAWETAHDTIASGVEVWLVGPAAAGFAPNVNVLTQPSRGLGLQEYLDLSVAEGEGLLDGFEVQRAQVVPGPDGEVGILEYSAVQVGRPLRFFAVVDIGQQVTVATLTSPPGTYEELRDVVEPHLMTLVAR